MPSLAYSYAAGPFKGLLVRRGYDPEADPTARYLQSINVRIRDDHLRSMLKRFINDLSMIVTFNVRFVVSGSIWASNPHIGLSTSTR